MSSVMFLKVAKEIIDDPKSNLEGENMAKWKTGLNMAFTLLETSREVQP